jgi:DNA repair exonuclease SbcCD nuclease subunit
MRRTNRTTKKPSAILTADFHLREDTPICRTDDFWGAQWDKVDQICKLQVKYNDCPILHAGDLFDHWKPSPFLLSTALLYLPEDCREFWTIYGNHDLPNHSIELAKKTGVMTLVNASAIRILPGCHWLQLPPNSTPLFPNSKYKMLVWHVMTWKDRNPIPDSPDLSAKQILKKYPQFDLIVTGHNHATFIEEYEGRLLVNPGSLTRQTSDQENHRPCVFLWYEESNTVEQVFLKINKGVVSREHLERKEEIDARIAAFVEKLNTHLSDPSLGGGLSFEENMERFKKVNGITKLVMDVVYKAMERENEY